MTVVYQVDTARIKRQLLYLQTCLDVIQEAHTLHKISEQFAVARALHVAIECVTDIGNALIDGFIMRDPGSYEDIVEILKDEQVLPAAEADVLKRLVEHRKLLVLHYTDVDQTRLEQLVQLAQPLKPFAKRIEAYLQREMGPNAITFHT